MIIKMALLGKSGHHHASGGCCKTLNFTEKPSHQARTPDVLYGRTGVLACSFRRANIFLGFCNSLLKHGDVLTGVRQVPDFPKSAILIIIFRTSYEILQTDDLSFEMIWGTHYFDEPIFLISRLITCSHCNPTNLLYKLKRHSEHSEESKLCNI